jgi:23S rRNA maturation mini-RNase III
VSKKKPYISQAFAEGKIDRKLRMLEGVARILSDNYDVTVHFSPNGECKTTPEVMTLPYDKGVDEALILGLCGHETGHLKFTEFAIARVISRHKKIHNRPLLYVIFNCLEDVRIEAEMEKVYPGFQEMFKRLIPYIKEKKEPILKREEKIKSMRLAGKSNVEIEKEIEKDCRDELKGLIRTLRGAGFSEEYIATEVEQLKQAQSSPIAEVQKILDVLYLILRGYDYDWYPPEVTEYVDLYLLEVAEEVHTTKSSQEVLDVAIKIYNILTDHEKKLRKGAQRKVEDKKKSESKKNMKEDTKEDGKGKGKRREESESLGNGEDGEDGASSRKTKKKGEGDSDEEGVVRIGLTKVLRVGSKVTHLNDPSKKGVVTHIASETREVTVEWE